ncbi:P-loop containing nucleoside triphosphate hydrolase protein [Athelia psychrophila]|uniref:P-loop containing nucleoside triphosphate hydrolase protein n=1 Tax=Athelia psychrophila TaxID=1759441 RepID=A0A166JPI9_9AGAM|nr:P-loop containing nucleoside triphosphate hydrolase protein [Fibularhizoctonia sp. CBS 109695]
MQSDILLAPAGLTGVSALVLVASSIFHALTKRAPTAQGVPKPGIPKVGRAIFVCRLLQLAGCLVLLGLSVASTLLQSRPVSDFYAQISICVAFGYAVILAALSAFGPPGARRPAVDHLTVLLLVTMGVYAYRDIYPLAIVGKHPMDSLAGRFLWPFVSVLALTSIGPLVLAPREYVPVHPEHPTLNPSPEQTASPLSFVLWAFLDPLIIAANRAGVAHLGYDQLPALLDSDEAHNLVAASFPVLDPFTNNGKRHIFWGLVKIFRYEFSAQSLTMVVQALAYITTPIGVVGVLDYLEHGDSSDSGAAVRPWVWISWLLCGPIAASIANQLNTYYATRTLVRTEGIITQLVFEHSLRIRMKAETRSADEGDDATQIGTPTESVVGASTTDLSEAASASSGKRNPKSRDEGEEAVPAPPTPKTKSSDNLVGLVNNLVTTDLANISEGRNFIFLLVYIPLQVIVCIAFLYRILGWSSIIGFIVMLLLFPLPGWVAQQMQHVEAEKLKQTDSRVQTVTETLGVLRMIKLFGWENKMNDKLREIREHELYWTRKATILRIVNNNVNFCMPIFTMLATFATYTLVMKKDLSASTVYGSMTAFEILRNQIHMGFQFVPSCIQGKVSLDRVNAFLNDTELLDAFSGGDEDTQALDVESDIVDRDEIGFGDAIFTWTETSDGTVTPSRRDFSLHLESNLVFKRGALNMIIGPTGSGKTSLLMALLGEMHFIRPGPGSWFNLPRSGGVAYAAQESWVQNETIKENILFGAPFDEERYTKVIRQCALTRDLELFDAGDATEVGEKGLTLSGGQKARITLARAIYSSAEILLLDDVLAALDVHTSKWIVDNCFTGDLVQGRTIILVTHNIAMVSPIADFVVSLGADGRVLSQGSVTKALAKDPTLVLEAEEDREALEKADAVIDPKVEAKTDGKLIVDEDIAEGHVSWAALKSFFLGLGGKHPIIFWAGYLGFSFIGAFTDSFGPWWLGFWAAQYESHTSSAEVSVVYYLTVYVLTLALDAAIYTVGSIIWLYGTLRVSRSIHKELVDSVLGTTLRWLDKTPTSRVVTRTTQDIRALDGPITQNFDGVAAITLFTVVKLGLIVFFSPLFLLPCLVVIIIGVMCGNVYNKTVLSVKREMSNARAPVLAHFGAAITGLVSVRAYGAQEAFRTKTMSRIDKYTRTARTFYNLSCWIALRIDVMGAVFTTSLASYLVYSPLAGHLSAAEAGFSLNLAASFSFLVLWWVKCLNEFEISSSSLERIHEYSIIEQEPVSTEGGQPPAYWPASGEIRVEGLSARYSADGPKVLHDISFNVRSGERIGVVGRTGSGKSSLTLALLRCILTEGNVYYDGLPTHSLNLDALRSSITIIPQSPELLSGTLRQNLDPFDQYDDATLNDALRGAGLYSLQSDMTDGKITLETPISSGGGNLSVGQRQILALARAIVRGSKLLILDEATSAIDYKTDSVIQTSLRNELGSDVTLITVAHRLQTIMDADRIMVLDAGRIAEFDTPAQLLQNDKGRLRALVDESKDKDVLIAMANSASGPATS